MNELIKRTKREDKYSINISYEFKNNTAWCSSEVRVNKSQHDELFGVTINTSASGSLSVQDTKIFVEMVNAATNEAEKICDDINRSIVKVTMLNFFGDTIEINLSKDRNRDVWYRVVRCYSNTDHNGEIGFDNLEAAEKRFDFDVRKYEEIGAQEL